MTRSPLPVRLLDSNDAAITTIGTGSTFTMEVTVRDLRDFIAAADRGIFNAFVDINFDQAKLELVGNTQINPVFYDNNSARPGTRTAGHILTARAASTPTKRVRGGMAGSPTVPGTGSRCNDAANGFCSGLRG